MWLRIRFVEMGALDKAAFRGIYALRRFPRQTLGRRGFGDKYRRQTRMLRRLAACTYWLQCRLEPPLRITLPRDRPSGRRPLSAHMHVLWETVPPGFDRLAGQILVGCWHVLAPCR